MQKSPRVWIAASQVARVLVPAGTHVPQASARGVPVQRRACLQGAELAGPWLLRAAVRLPGAGSDALPGRQACLWLGAVHARWLRYLGVGSAALHQGPDVVHWASFVARRPGDVVVGPRKITTIAETRRAGETVVIAGTLLRSPPWRLLCGALGRPEQEAAFLDACAVAANALTDEVDAQAWGAYLRSMLYLALAFTELQGGTLPAQ